MVLRLWKVEILQKCKSGITLTLPCTYQNGKASFNERHASVHHCETASIDVEFERPGKQVKRQRTAPQAEFANNTVTVGSEVATKFNSYTTSRSEMMESWTQ